MVCLYCGNETSVKNSRLQKRANAVWRRRECTECHATVTTLEKIDLATAVLVRTNTLTEPFSRDRLLVSIYESCKHRKDALGSSIALTDTIISNIYPYIRHAEVQKDVIINESLKVLRAFDPAAGVYYAAYHPKTGKKK